MDPNLIENNIFPPPAGPLPPMMDIGPVFEGKPLRSTSVSKAAGASTLGTAEFKSSFANTKFMGHPEPIPPRLFHSFE